MMRKQLITTVENVLDYDPRTVLLLGDIGVFGFRKAFDYHTRRVFNIGILEQSMTGLASGLALGGMIPIVHTIAPFMVERAYEQLKLDFGYQELGGNFISIGASYDYAALGSSHHCPADIGILKQIPNMEIVCPGTSEEFHLLFTNSYDNGNPTYFRLSEYENELSQSVEFGKANVVRLGTDATIIVVGNMLDVVLKATEDLNVTILYYTTLAPFDSLTLRENLNENMVLCEPYYCGGLLHDIVQVSPYPTRYKMIGVPHQFLTHYGTYEEHNIYLGLNIDGINKEIREFLYE
jgi:transketolase